MLVLALQRIDDGVIIPRTKAPGIATMDRIRKGAIMHSARLSVCTSPGFVLRIWRLFMGGYCGSDYDGLECVSCLHSLGFVRLLLGGDVAGIDINRGICVQMRSTAATAGPLIG